MLFFAVSFNFQFMDVFPIYFERHDLHRNLTRKGKRKHTLDCTHNCYSPETIKAEMTVLSQHLTANQNIKEPWTVILINLGSILCRKTNVAQPLWIQDFSWSKADHNFMLLQNFKPFSMVVSAKFKPTQGQKETGGSPFAKLDTVIGRKLLCEHHRLHRDILSQACATNIGDPEIPRQKKRKMVQTTSQQHSSFTHRLQMQMC